MLMRVASPAREELGSDCRKVVDHGLFQRHWDSGCFTSMSRYLYERRIFGEDRSYCGQRPSVGAFLEIEPCAVTQELEGDVLVLSILRYLNGINQLRYRSVSRNQPSSAAKQDYKCYSQRYQNLWRPKALKVLLGLAGRICFCICPVHQANEAIAAT